MISKLNEKDENKVLQESPTRQQFIEGKVVEIEEDQVSMPNRNKANFKVKTLVSPAGKQLNYKQLPGGHSTKVTKM